jgi:hypothetical protein
MRFQRSIKIFPGLRLNLSKSGLGVSAGVRGLRLGIDSKGRSYVNAGIPGTGLSVRQYAKKQEVPHVAPPPLQLPHSQPIQHIKTMGTGLESAGTGTKVVWAVVGAGVLLIGALLTISQPNKKSPADIVPSAEQHAIYTAEQELIRTHPEFKSTNVTPDGPYPAKAIADGFEVRLHYLGDVGGFLPFVCQVQQLTAKCAAPPALPRARKAGSPTPSTRTVPSNGLGSGGPVTGSRTYVGPRGGVYHYSRSGKKVYERRRR